MNNEVSGREVRGIPTTAVNYAKRIENGIVQGCGELEAKEAALDLWREMHECTMGQNAGQIHLFFIFQIYNKKWKDICDLVPGLCTEGFHHVLEIMHPTDYAGYVKFFSKRFLKDA